MQVLQQRFEFIQQLIECFHGLLYRKWRTHVHAGDLQQFDRMIRFTCLKEADIILGSRLAFCKDLFGDCRSCGITCSVFVYIERIGRNAECVPTRNGSHHLFLPLIHNIVH